MTESQAFRFASVWFGLPVIAIAILAASAYPVEAQESPRREGSIRALSIQMPPTNPTGRHGTIGPRQGPPPPSPFNDMYEQIRTARDDSWGTLEQTAKYSGPVVAAFFLPNLPGASVLASMLLDNMRETAAAELQVRTREIVRRHLEWKARVDGGLVGFEPGDTNRVRALLNGPLASLDVAGRQAAHSYLINELANQIVEIRQEMSDGRCCSAARNPDSDTETRRGIAAINALAPTAQLPDGPPTASATAPSGIDYSALSANLALGAQQAAHLRILAGHLHDEGIERLAGEFETGLALGTSVAAAFANPMMILPAINSVLGLFGTVGPSADQLLLAGQQRIMELLVDLSRQMAEQHRIQMEALGRINENVLFNRWLLTYLVAQDLNSCFNVLREVEETEEEAASGNHDARSMAAAVVSRAGADWVQCAAGISRHFTPNLDPVFVMNPSTSDAPQAVSRTSPASLRALARFLQDSVLAPSVELASVFGTLELAGPTASDFPLHGGNENHERVTASSFVRTNITGLLTNPHSVRRYVDMLRRLYVLRELMRADGTLLSRADPPQLEAYNWLENALDVLDLAVSQHALLAGDRLLSNLYDLLRPGGEIALREGGSIEEVGEKALALLEANVVLRRNLGIYIVRRELDIPERRTADLFWSGGAPARTRVATYFDTDWDLTWGLGSQGSDDEPEVAPGWRINISRGSSAIEVELPSTIDADYIIPPELLDLLALREGVRNEVISFDLVRSASRDEDEWSILATFLESPDREIAAPFPSRLTFLTAGAGR